ncbi:MAG: HD domain-containing protein [Deltaproteobacteria bacterium]|nr:HD domain-containing protein [Deltaproteobacteria bacterium]MCL5880147.1 HD domain-containing protein [Deltaproteobacteria bacterium]MDA8304803.1 HD domain-containing protein [Deltaproteobacteria bacterium]
MEKILVSDIKENQKVESIFLVKSKSRAAGKTGKPYIYLKLADKTGEIKGYIWDNIEKYNELFDAGDLIKIKSKSTIFQNELQLSISELEKLGGEDISENLLRLFLKSTKYDIDAMFSELSNLLNETLSDEYIIKLAKKFLNDENYIKKLKTMPAAKSIHHGYIGGLLEHTLSMLNIGIFLSKHYEKYVNKDILIASILLHDVGKMEELSNKNNITEYSDDGKLLGHIVLGANIIDKKIDEIQGFPKNLRTLLLHSIISHHGELEFGSPKRPKTVEALLLHFIDNMDAKTNQFIDATEGQNAPWSPYSKQLDRYLLNSKIFYSQKLKETDDAQRGTKSGLNGYPDAEEENGGAVKDKDGDNNSNEVFTGELF